MWELFSYAEMQKHPGHMVFVSLEKAQNWPLMTKGQ
jgi:hypothetical protein